MKGYRSVMFIALILFGIIISLQFRGVINKSEVSAKELTVQLQAAKEENRKLLEQISNVEAEREQLLNNMGDNIDNENLNKLLGERDYEYLRAGLTTVTGRGIVITMEDALAKGEMDIEEYIIHDSDVNAILDELKAYGAEAISINDERVIFSTKPVCAGPTIIVNESRYPPPYVIKAIGDPDVLYEAIETMAQVAFMRLADIRVDIEKQDQVVVKKYHLYRSLDKMFKDLEVVRQ